MEQDAAGSWVIVELTVRAQLRGQVPEWGDKAWASKISALLGPRPVGAEVTSEALRQIRLAPIRRWARQVIAQQTWEPAVRPRRSSEPGRPMQLDRGFYVKVGQRYRALNRAGDPHIAKTLAAEFGYTRTGMRAVLSRYRKHAALKGYAPI